MIASLEPLKPGARLVDVATRAGVSVPVASVALRGVSGGTVRVSSQTAERVRRVAREMAYRPNMAAQILKGRKNDVIGVLIGAASTPANYGRLSAIEREAYRRGYRLMIGQFHEDPAHTAGSIDDFLSRGIDSLICFHNPLMPSDTDVLGLLCQARALVFQTKVLVRGACRVDVDRAAGVVMGVGQLRDRGCRRIGLLLNAPASKDPLMRDRLRGYTTTLTTRKPHRPVVWSGTGEFPPSRDLVDEAVRELVQAQKCDGIAASNDVWAIELIKGLRRAGLRVPQDVAVVGFDNLQAGALFDPALTTIDQNNEGFARATVDLILESLERGPLPPAKRERVVQPALVVRESA